MKFSLMLFVLSVMYCGAIRGLDRKAKGDFDRLMIEIQQDFSCNPTIEKSVLSMFNDKKGYFSDIDYTHKERTNWQPMLHIKRLLDFSFAYTSPENVYYRNNDLYHKIVNGLTYWHKVNPQCDNWWYNQVSEPQNIGILLIQMRKGDKQIPDSLEKNLLRRIKEEGGHPAKWTGANRTDIALHWIYRSCLTQNEQDLKLAVNYAFSPLVYTTKEGFQYDNSFFQHDMQLYIGGYGDEIIKGVTQVALYMIVTQYALSKEKINLLSTFVRKTYSQTIRGKYMLFNVLGRGISRPNALNRSSSSVFIRRMMKLDPANKKEYENIAARIEERKPSSYAVTASHIHFFCADYTLHIRPSYTFDVRMVSDRTVRCESVNKENLKTYFLSDGCTNIVSKGDEYYNIFPVWDWRKIPGVTAPQLDSIPLAKGGWQTQGTAQFAGGVSDSTYGASAYSYNDTFENINTQAKKSWFFFDNEIVCMGNVTSLAQRPVFTTINQCHLNGSKIMVNKHGEMFSSRKGRNLYNSPQWILHNKIGYIFPQGGTVLVDNVEQCGSWYEINRTSPKDLWKHKVFTLAFDHGNYPKNEPYAYIVVPGMDSAEEIDRYCNKHTIEIISNTDKVQSVYQKQLNIWQIVFFEAGSLQYGQLKVTANAGCIVMLKKVRKDQYQLHISDPAQLQQKIKLTIGCPNDSSHHVTADFRNSGTYAGASKAYIINS